MELRFYTEKEVVQISNNFPKIGYHCYKVRNFGIAYFFFTKNFDFCKKSAKYVEWKLWVLWNINKFKIHSFKFQKFAWLLMGGKSWRRENWKNDFVKIFNNIQDYHFVNHSIKMTGRNFVFQCFLQLSKLNGKSTFLSKNYKSKSVIIQGSKQLKWQNAFKKKKKFE